ncbi:MAG: prepilin-type N-terminal cleavage/methylation domain-containing protein [Planctomycetes bacterium]|nr:prepilin-type N-terminal cleavage/methylation domain-containing protein [Planctomycetota bacterium]
MKTAMTRWEAGRRGPGFTLVEIMAAMSLAVIIMLGVVQVFRMATDSVSKAEATSDSYQMARGLFSILQKDLWATSRDGYLYVQPGMLLNPDESRSSSGTYPLSGDIDSTSAYNYDCLYFSAVGRFREVGTGSQNPDESAAAEIFYGPAYRKGKKATNPWASPEKDSDKQADARSVCLVRKAFLCESTMGTNVVPVSGSPVTSKHTFIKMQEENTLKDMTTMKYRLTPLTTGAAYGYSVSGSPIVDVYDKDGFDPNVNFVLSDRASQFLVELWVWDGKAFRWQRAAGRNRSFGEGSYWTTRRTYTSGEYAKDTTVDSSGDLDLNEKYLWCGYRPNPGFDRQPFMPQMIRVTVVIHPHSDQAPLYDQPYAGVFRGDVFRQVFRLTGTRGGLRDIPDTYYKNNP